MRCSIVCTLTLQVKQTFKADSHPHYLFTPRDLTKLVKGLLQYSIPDGGDGLLQVVMYEARRIFRDRLVSSAHRETFDSILSAVAREEWSFNAASIDRMYFTTWGSSGQANLESVPLGCLAEEDLKQIISKAILQYSE